MNTPDSILAACVWLSRHRVGQSQMMALLHVAKARSATMGEIADVAGVSRAGITGIVDALVDRGWFARVDDEDRRVVRVIVTPAGEKAIAEMFQPAVETLHETFSR